MSLPQIEKRVRRLEALSLPVDCRCNCRTEEVTLYHNAADLARIITARCPVHGIRDLGCVSWVPSGMPLNVEDRCFCSCPPCPAREWLEGKRGPLTEDEQDEECRSWKQQLTTEATAESDRDQATVTRLLQKYRARRERK